MTRSQSRVLLLLLMLGLFIAALSVQAQDLPTNDTPPNDVVLPTQEPTLAPEPVLPTEDPISEPTAVPTEEPTTPPTESTPVESETPDAVETDASQAPTAAPVVLPLAYSAHFDAGYPVELSTAANWVSVDVEGGHALQALTDAAAITYTAASFGDGAVEARFLLNAGEGRVTLGTYAARLNSTGLVTLSQGDADVATAQAILTAGEWVKVRLQISAGQIRVSVNDSLVIEAQGTSAEGFAGFAASNAAVLRVDDFAVYGTPINVYAPAAPETPVAMAEPKVDVPAQEAPASSGEVLPMASLPQAGDTINLFVSYTLTNKITLSWNDLTSEQNYDVEQSFDSGTTWSPLTTLAANVTGYEITGLTCGDWRRFRVRGYVNTPAYEVLAVSNPGEGRTVACTTFSPITPANGAEINNTSTPLMRWTAVQGANGYIIDVSTNTAFTVHVHESYPYNVGSRTGHFPLSTTLPNGTYYWRVRNEANNTWSDTWSFVLNNLPSPTSFSQTGTFADHIPLTWSDVAGEDGYLIDQSNDNINWTPVTTTAADVTSYDMTGLECGYRISVLRVRSFSNTPSYRTSASKLLGIPVNQLSITTSPCTITPVGPDDGMTFSDTNPTFAWNAAPNTLQYRLDISNGGAYGYPKYLTGTSYFEDSLPNGTYLWRVRVNSPVLSNETDFRSFTITDRPTPVIPTGLRISNNLYDKVRLEWTDVSNEGGYVIEQSPDKVNWTYTGTVAADVTLYDVLPATCDPTPYYRVRAVSILSAATVFAPTPNANVVRGQLLCPSTQSPAYNATVTTNAVSFAWSTLPGTTQYELDISTSPNFTTSLSGYPKIVYSYSGGTTLSYISDALPNGTLYWRVRTAQPVQSVYSVPSKIIVSTYANFVPDAPVPLLPMSVGIVRTTRPTFSWQAVPGAVEYEIQVDNDPTFLSIHTSGRSSTTSYSMPATINDEMAQGIQYWRVRTIFYYELNSPKTYSPWSAPLQFTVNPALTPADNTVVPVIGTAITAKVVFTWAAAPSTTFPPVPPIYTVQVDDDPAFGSENYSCVSNVVTAKTCFVPSMAQGIYYWRVLRNGEVLPTPAVSNRFIVSPVAVRAPTLVSPTNAKVLQPSERPNVVLDWSWGTLPTPVGTYTYDVVISTNNTFTVEPTDSATGLNDSTYTTNTLPNGVYYWRARAVNNYGAPGTWSAPFSFTVDGVAPDAPVIKAPALNAIVPTARPTFTWAASVGASRYLLEVHATACDDGTVLYTSPSITTLTFAIPATAALSQGPQVVCIKAYDAAGNEGSFGEARAFTVFLGLAPAANAFVPLTTKPTFTWTATTGTTAYTLEIDNDPAFDGTVDAFPTMTIPLGNVAKYILPNTLPEGTYYWRVVRGGETLTSNVSRTFYVGALLNGPTLTEPNPGQSIKLPTMLRWNAASAPTGAAITAYQVEISKAATFVPLAVPSITITLPSALETQFTPPVAQNAVRYYWRVRGLVNGSPVTNWSSSNVLVDNVAPGLPTVASPAANALLNTVRPAITWAPVAGATRYTVAIKDTVADVDVVPEQSVTGTSLVLTVNLPQSELVLRVRAEDTINSGDWRSVNFKVRLGTLPAQNAIVTSTRPGFTWLAVPTATAYTLQVDNDPLFDNTVDTFPTLTIPLGNVLTYTLNANQGLPPNGVYYWRVKTDLVGVDYPANTGSRSFYVTTPTATKPMGLASLAAATAPVSMFNKATYQSGGVTLSWNNVTPRPSLYEVEVSTAATFAPTGTTQHTAAVTALPTSTLLLTGNQLTDGLKYWRVRAVYSADRTSYGLWSDVKQFTLDQVPPLPPIIPATVSQYSTTNRPTFIWTASATAARYYLTVQGTSINSLQVVGTSYKLPTTVLPLPQNSDEGYAWFVEAEDVAGNRSAVSSSVMYIFVGTSPKDEQFLTDTTPAFTWTPVTGTGAATWTLEISHDVDMTDDVYTSPVIAANLGTFTLPNGNPLPTGVYYWRVYRQGEDLTHLLGAPFYIVPNITGATALPEYPYNGMTLGVSDLNPFLYVQWKNLAPQPESLVFSKAYLFEISTNSTFTNLVDFRIVPVTSSDESSAMYWEDMAVVDGKQYYWRVRGIFGKTAEDLGPNPALEDFLGLDVGPTGGIYTFKVDLTAPGTPTQTSPIVNALVTTRTPTFVWTAAPLVPARYRVEIAQDSGFTTILQSTTTTTPALTLTLPAYQALPNGAYYWRVVAIDLADNEGVPSAGRRFVVAAP